VFLGGYLWTGTAKPRGPAVRVGVRLDFALQVINESDRYYGVKITSPCPCGVRSHDAVAMESEPTSHFFFRGRALELLPTYFTERSI
jgi:hypothetical protein